ncbi:MAG TPA: hypothetical protein DCZ83_01735 [Candidatus Yonathbacteria bacterium]|nr:hypothetical protein [Candidatus Yonathbacteria bacterium]
MLLINRLSLSKLLAVFTVLAVFLSFQNIAFALTTGQVYPSLGTTVSEPPWSDNTWDTPANIYTDDGTNAEVTAPSYDNGDQTFVLKATGFDFSTIPDGSTINGITARINSYYSAGSGSIDLCQLFNVSRAKVGTNQCSTVVPLTTNTATIITKGSASDTWGNALTSAWVKDSDFGIAIGILATSNNTDVHVDYVTLEIDYTLSNTAPTLSISEPNGSGDTVTVGDSYNITYSLADAEQTVTADFYYDTNNSGLDGTLITGCQNQTEGVGATCSWNTTGVTPGSYYVYGRDVTDGIAPEVSAYSSGTITINAPPASGTVSASPDTCTILSGASTCTVPFTWSISNATSPKLYNATRFIEYSTSASGSGVSFAITNGSNTVQVRDSTAVLNSTTATGSCTDGTSWNGSSCAVVVTYYDIVASSGANGSVTPTGTTTVAQGGSQAYSIAPISGYEVATLLIDGGAITATTTYTFSNVTANHTISATFSLLPVTHTITSSAGSNGSITPLGAIVVADGASQAFSIIPESGFYTATLLVDGGTVSTSSPYTFTNVTADHTIVATFALIPPPPGSFTIIANQNPNGSVSPSGSTIVTEGDSQIYTITPDSGYDVGSLIIDSSPLSSTSTSYTFTNVTADHTIEATFIALPGTEPAPVATVRRLASVTFQGRAFPDGKISIVRKELGNEIVTKERGGADANGFFNIRFTDLQTGAHSFGLLIKDPDGRTSQTKFFVVDVSRGDEIFKDIIAPPTVDILNGQVSRGGNLKVFGYASPGHTIRVYFDDILVKEALAGRGGVYSFDVPTGALDFGQHKVRAKQINLDGGRESDYSTERTFVVSKLTVVKADFSGDGKVDITDWSIFLARWGSKSSLGRAGIDLNSDGKIDITDFSIFIKTIRKK